MEKVNSLSKRARPSKRDLKAAAEAERNNNKLRKYHSCVSLPTGVFAYRVLGWGEDGNGMR